MESSAFRLRPYQPSDFETLLRIDQACFPRGIAYGRQEMKYYLRSEGARCLIAEADGQMAGFILIEQSAEFAHIITLDVLETYRRRSIGSALLEAAEKAATQQGAPRMVLETATTNKPAIALWKKHGYREIVTIADYYGPGLDAYEMHKTLRHSPEGN
ncbi:MAG: GNAT family N-acetyltransferase [Acidobacteriia bacterium]|nr:GNAT family N-acetyltransferase [Terriglobia bacterium]